MEQVVLGFLPYLAARLHWLSGWLASFDSLWWMKLAITVPLAILVAQLIRGGRKAKEQKHWRMYS